MTYASIVERLRSRTEMPLFAGQIWDPALQEAVGAATPESLFPGREIADPQAAVAVVAGLRLWNDDFDGAHGLAQGLRSATGSYWHALCHRREGERGSGVASNLNNSRYWVRQAGLHPAFAGVYRRAVDILAKPGADDARARAARLELEARGEWDPEIVLSWIEPIAAGASPGLALSVIEEIQRQEIMWLTEWCARRALGDEAAPAAGAGEHGVPGE